VPEELYVLELAMVKLAVLKLAVLDIPPLAVDAVEERLARVEVILDGV
jgi:hypothetical protein